jgi:transcriptional regulator GlxA family with amidase domain
MQIALALYPRFTMLDIVGPFQVLVDVPGHDVAFVAAQGGLVPDHTGRGGLIATRTFNEMSTPDVIVVPGGMNDDMNDPVVDWIRQVHATTTWTTSVCTGSLFLAAAGLLEGLDATCHWQEAKRLEELGARYTEERVVTRGKVITSAGVSSGIDMALTLLDHLHGPLIAQAIQLAIEYDPQPPFNAGSPSKAPSDVVELVEAFFAAS